MKHIITTTLLLVLALLLPTHALAHDFEVNGIYYNINGTNATVTYKGTHYSQYSNEYSGSVTIPATVTYGGTTYSVTTIGSSAFEDCSNLTNISIPNSVTSIKEHAFYGCSSLTNINIPNSVTSIGDAAFSYCPSLATISVTSDNTKYDSRNNCNAIIETATNTLIAGCKNTTIPNSVTNIGNSAFHECYSLTNIDIPNSITNIGNSAFSGCDSLTTVYLPNSVTNIGNYAFHVCSSLTNINIPNSVTNIGQGAFYGCSSLTNISIPNSVTNIGNSAFRCCFSLATIIVASNNPKYDSRNNCNAIIETATNTLIVGCENTTIPNSVTAIGNSAFYYCSSLTSINIPNSVTSIDERAFSGCSSLTNINIPNSVTNIGSYAFSDCSSLTNINIPNSVTTIGNYAFSDCDGLTSVDIGNSVVSIGEHAFYHCSSLTNIIIPNSVTSIGQGALNGTPWYDNQPNGLVYAGLVAYQYKGTMPQGTSITIKDGTKGIAGGAFSGCSSLTNINIPNSVTSIGVSAFYECSNLTNINIPNSVTTIGYAAFYRCSSLNDVYCYATTPPECKNNPFSNYSATLHVPATSLAAYFTAPVWSNFENIVGDAVATTGIAINMDSVEMSIGEQIELAATVTPANASCKEVTWYSTDTSVATVDNGILNATGYGECDIIAYCSNVSAKCHVKVVTQVSIISLDMQEAMVLPNHMLTLTPTATLMPSGFTATSSDPTVAAVRVMSGKVQVVGIKEGTTTITVASTDGTAQPATCLVTVYTEPCDVNCDGFITIGDATQMIDYLLGGSVDNFKVANADVNGDGNVSIGDVTALIDQLLSSNN